MSRLLAPALFLSALGTASLSAQEKWVESPVTLSLAFAETGETQLRENPNGTSTRTARLEKFSVGNRQVLEALVADELIPDLRGWKLVAIWAYWPDEDPYVGNSYRFYAVKGSGNARQTVAVPSYILNIAPLVWEVGVKHVLAAQEEESDAEATILSGSETYQVYTQVRFNFGGVEGDPIGVQTGTGEYKKVSGQQAGRYVPKASKTTLQGLFTRDGESVAGVVTGALSFGAGKFVRGYDQMPEGMSTGSLSYTYDYAGSILELGVAIGDDSSIGASGTVTLGSGSLTLSGANTYTGTLVVGEGSTLNLGAASTSLGGTLTFSLESAGNLVAANGGTWHFIDGSTLNLEPGVIFDLSTLGSGQLGTSATFTLNPTDGTLSLTPPEGTQPPAP